MNRQKMQRYSRQQTSTIVYNIMKAMAPVYWGDIRASCNHSHFIMHVSVTVNKSHDHTHADSPTVNKNIDSLYIPGIVICDNIGERRVSCQRLILQKNKRAAWL